MTVVNPKSISGINSITMASGSDNLLTIHTTNTTERVRVNSDGDVIVGSGITVSPDGDIFATGVTTATTFVGALTGNVTGNATGLSGTPNISAGTIAGSTGTFTGDVDIADKIVHTGDTDTAIRFSGADTIQLETGGAARFTLSGGNVVQQSGTLYIKNATGDSSGLKLSQESGDESRIFNHYSGALTFGTANTERARIDSSGRLMIGTTSTSGISASGDDIIIGSIGDSTSRGITFATTADGTIRWADAGDNAMGRVQYHNGTDVMTFHTSNTQRLRLDSDGGIKFGSDTAAANALDDYEEGSWTPNIRNDGTTATWSSQQGRYVKIGQQVTVWFNADGGSSPRSGGTSSSLIMTGLPFSQVMFGNPILGSVGANKSSGSGLYSTIGVILSPFGQGGTQVRFGAGGQPINFGIDYVAGCFTYTAS